MKIIILTLLSTISVLTGFAQNRFTLSGVITDTDNQPVIGAVVACKEIQHAAAVSDINGKFSFSLPKGKYTVITTFIGYESLENRVEMTEDRSLRLVLKIKSMELEEVVVTSKSAVQRLSNVQIGVEKIEIAEMVRTPALFGERDIIKSLSLLPGIKAESDGSSGFQVRGGTSSQNLILLDDAPVYNSGHLMGIFSAFNDDALVNASLYKGQIPAQYGGATSSVFDINTKTGDRQDYNFGANIGILSAKVSADGPIVKDKASFFISARRSYADLFLKAVEDYKDNVMNFYDINAKVSYQVNQNNIVSLSFFTGRDNMGVKDLMDMKWGNSNSTLKWFHRYGDKLNSSTSLIWSAYNSDNGMEVMNTKNSFEGFIRNYSLRHVFAFTPTDKHNLRFGFQSTLIDLQSAKWLINNLDQSERRKSWDNSLWINEEWKVNDKLGLSAGVRLNIFSILGGSPYYELDDNGDIIQTLDYGKGEFVKNYFLAEPRFSANYRIATNQSIKLGYSRTSQNIHALRNSTMSMPFDRYTMTSNIIKPQTADQMALGYSALTKDQKFEFSVEGYYKAIKNVYDYKDGKSFSSEIEVERLLLGGEGRAYGVELSARKNIGRLTGWIGYTLSWSENKIAGINNDQWYTAGNDRRHDISIVAMYDLTDTWSASATWQYNTGQALTAPSGKYDIDGEPIYYYAERNGYRAPAYHRLDVSFTNTKKLKKYTRIWNFGIYNLYNRYNPFIITFENDDTKPTGTKTVLNAMFGLVPSASFGIKF